MIYVLHGVIVIRLCTRRKNWAKFLQRRGVRGKGKTEGNERCSEWSPDGLKCSSRNYNYIVLSERTRVVVVYKRKIYKTLKLMGKGGNEELISVLLNFCCYNDSVESSTMQK